MFVRGLIFLFSIFGWVLYQSTHRIRFLIGCCLAFFWFDLFRIRRQIVLDNLEIAFPEMSSSERVKLGRKVMQNFCTHLFEVFMIPFLRPEWVEKNVVYHGADHYEKALQKGKGVLVLCLHIGYGDVSGALIQMRGFPLTVITKYFKSSILNRIWFHFRGAKGLEFIAPHGEKTPFEILKALKKQRGVVFVNDQYMGPPFGIETKFFGRSTGTAFGLGLFMMKTGAPIIPVYSHPGQDGKIHVYFDPEMDLKHLITGDKKQDLLKMTQAFNDKIEEIVRKYPEHWMWIHRRWKEFG